MKLTRSLIHLIGGMRFKDQFVSHSPFLNPLGGGFNILLPRVVYVDVSFVFYKKTCVVTLCRHRDGTGRVGRKLLHAVFVLDLFRMERVDVSSRADTSEACRRRLRAVASFIQLRRHFLAVLYF